MGPTMDGRQTRIAYSCQHKLDIRMQPSRRLGGALRRSTKHLTNRLFGVQKKKQKNGKRSMRLKRIVIAYNVPDSCTMEVFILKSDLFPNTTPLEVISVASLCFSPSVSGTSTSGILGTPIEVDGIPASSKSFGYDGVVRRVDRRRNWITNQHKYGERERAVCV